MPTTNRPANIHFKTDTELAAVGLTPHAICVAQCHYSILRHLSRAHDILSTNTPKSLDALTEAFVRLCGALDLAFEVLERQANPAEYNPWDPDEGKRAQKAWQKKTQYPLQDLRDYRNILIHGRLLPAIQPGMIYQALFIPKIGAQRHYLDWRIITDASNHHTIKPGDLALADDVLKTAWKLVVNFLESSWKAHLGT